MTPATSRRLCALECAAAAKSEVSHWMAIVQLDAYLAERFGHVPTTEESRQEIRRLTAEGTDTARGAA